MEEDAFSLTMPRRMSLPANSNLGDSLLVKLKRSKEEADSAKKQLDQMLQKLHKLEKTAVKHQKLSVMAKTNCIKLYEVKKHKMYSRTLMEESRQRKEIVQEQQFETTQQKRLEDEVIRDMVRNQEASKRVRNRQSAVSYKRSLNQQLQQTHLSLYESCHRQADSVRKCKSRLADRRKLIQDFVLDRGRQNYLNKMQRELKSIQAYKDKIVDMEEEMRDQEQFSQIFTKVSGDSQKKVVSTNNMSFFLTDRRADSCRK